jgi:hypothetical protein
MSGVADPLFIIPILPRREGQCCDNDLLQKAPGFVLLETFGGNEEWNQSAVFNDR